MGSRTKGRELAPYKPPFPVDSISMETIMSAVAAMMDHPKEFHRPTMEGLKTAEAIVQRIDPRFHFHHISDTKTVASIVMIARLIEAQKVSDTLPVAPCKCR